MLIKISKNLLIFSYNVVGDRMEKRLPKVFANTIQKKINNNLSVFHLKNVNDNNNIIEEKEKKSIDFSNTVNGKISKIFKSTKYVYKMNVEITTKDGSSIVQIVGKNKGNLITLDNKLIPIEQIIDINEI